MVKSSAYLILCIFFASTPRRQHSPHFHTVCVGIYIYILVTLALPNKLIIAGIKEIPAGIPRQSDEPTTDPQISMLFAGQDVIEGHFGDIVKEPGIFNATKREFETLFSPLERLAKIREGSTGEPCLTIARCLY